MSGRANSKKRRPDIGELIEIDDLPPLDHDEATTPETDDFASFIEPLDEPAKEPARRHHAESDILNPVAIGRDLIDDVKEASYLEDWDPRKNPAQPELDMGLSIDEEDGGFTDEPNETETHRLENDWFVEDPSDSDSEMDEGEEGPANERIETFQIEEDSWDELLEDAEEELEVTLEAMERLGIDLPETHDETSSQISAVFETQFLGPASGGINRVVFQGGSLVAAGESLFSLGADGMFHGNWNEETPILNANSIYVRGESIYMGTQDLGAMVTQDKGHRFRQLNTWFTQGLFRNVQASSEQVSTSFSICGQETQAGYRLLGRTGRGQLFASVDGGKTWRNLAIPGHCVALTPVHGTPGIFMTSRSKNGTIEFHTAIELDEWSPTPMPPFWPAFDEDAAVSMAANGPVRLVGVRDVNAKLAFSVDNGSSWNRVDELSGAGSVAIDPDDPLCMAAAAFDIPSGFYVVLLSEDQGETWHTIFKLEGIRPNRIIDLAIQSGRTREIAVVTRRGVYQLALTRKGVSH